MAYEAYEEAVQVVSELINSLNGAAFVAIKKGLVSGTDFYAPIIGYLSGQLKDLSVLLTQED